MSYCYAHNQVCTYKVCTDFIAYIVFKSVHTKPSLMHHSLPCQCKYKIILRLCLTDRCSIFHKPHRGAVLTLCRKALEHDLLQADAQLVLSLHIEVCECLLEHWLPPTQH